MSEPAIIKKLKAARFTVQEARGSGVVGATYYASDSKTDPEKKAGSIKQPEREVELVTFYATDNRGRKALIDYEDNKLYNARFRDTNGAWRVTTIKPIEDWAKQTEDNVMPINGLVAAWPENGVSDE